MVIFQQTSRSCRLYFSWLSLCLMVVGVSFTVSTTAAMVLPAPSKTEWQALKMPRYLYYYAYPSYSDATSAHNTEAVLPRPRAITKKALDLSVKEAILLALRNNPDVRSAELQRVIDKYNVQIARNEFEPQYSLSSNATYQKGSTANYTVDSSVSLKNGIGTQYKVSYSDQLDGGDSTSGTGTFSVTQPLLQGFGAVNLVNYQDALSNENIAQLTFKNNIMTVVDQVVDDYRQLVQSYNKLDLDKKTLSQSQILVDQMQLKVKAGKMAASDVAQQKAQLATTELAVVQEQNAIQIRYEQFLSTLGLDPNAKLSVKRRISIKDADFPKKPKAIRMALAHNIAYQQALIQIQNTKRAVLSAEDKTRWQLNASAEATVGEGAIHPSGTLSLEIPIDDISDEAGLVDAKIALTQAKLALQQLRRDTIRKVMTQWNTIQNDRSQIKVAKRNVDLQHESLQAEQIKLQYGRTTVLNLTQVQNSALAAENQLVNAKIRYLNDVTAFRNTLGMTLAHWNIKLMY